MSQAPHDNIDVPNPGPNAGDHQYPPGPPLSAHDQESRGISDHVDGSGPIFSLYLEMATEEDKKMAESWKEDADGILIFTGLFSAAVASLISVSIQDLQQNPQDTSNFYLANMYQATINPNGSNSLPTSLPPFTPPNYAIWVNALWFLSLVISITCALLATLLQQWARRYLKVTRPRYSPHKRARIRAFFAEGVNKFLLPWAVEALPTMLHLSLFLFFAGLAVFLWNVNLTIFRLVLSWVGLCTALYGCITFIPVFRHDSPYHTPLSLPAWHLVTGIRFITFRALEKLTLLDYFSPQSYYHFRNLAEGYRKLLVRGMWKMAEESALSSPPEIDTRAFMWTFDCLDEDHELEHFFSGLPGFRSSKMVKDPLPDLTWEQQEKLLDALIGLSDRTASSDLLPEPVKIRRTVICGKAIGPLDIPEAIQRVLGRIFYQGQDGLVQSAAMARLVRGWDNFEDGETTMLIQAILSSAVARAPRHDDLWFAMATDVMGLPESVLRDYATYGDNLSLAILIHLVRQQFSLYWEWDWPQEEFSKVLDAASKFNVLNTSPALQHEFCALWNQVVHGAGYVTSSNTLKPIRNIYLTLHLHTDSAPTAFSTVTSDEDDILKQPSTYPLCNIPGHHPDSTPPIHDVSAPIAISHAVLHDNAAPVLSSLSSIPNASSPSLITPVHVDKNAVDVPLLDNILVIASPPRAHQTAMENLHNSAPSTNPAAAVSTQDNPSARIMAPAIRETSMFTSSVPPPAVVSFQNNADLMVHFGTPEIPSSASPDPVLDNILPTEPHSSMTGSMSPRTSPLPTSTPELVAATSDEGSPKASLHKHKDSDALDLPQVDRASQANAISIVNILPQLPPLPSLTDIAITGPLRKKPDDEKP